MLPMGGWHICEKARVFVTFVQVYSGVKASGGGWGMEEQCCCKLRPELANHHELLRLLENENSLPGVQAIAMGDI